MIFSYQLNADSAVVQQQNAEIFITGREMIRFNLQSFASEVSFTSLFTWSNILNDIYLYLWCSHMTVKNVFHNFIILKMFKLILFYQPFQQKYFNDSMWNILLFNNIWNQSYFQSFIFPFNVKKNYFELSESFCCLRLFFNNALNYTDNTAKQYQKWKVCCCKSRGGMQ